jgi:threonine-phosphate decarboxylase
MALTKAIIVLTGSKQAKKLGDSVNKASLVSSTNFILIKTKKNSTQLQKKLLEHKILIRDCKNFRGLNNHHIRISVKSHKDNLKHVKAL